MNTTRKRYENILSNESALLFKWILPALTCTRWTTGLCKVFTLKASWAGGTLKASWRLSESHSLSLCWETSRSLTGRPGYRMMWWQCQTLRETSDHSFKDQSDQSSNYQLNYNQEYYQMLHMLSSLRITLKFTVLFTWYTLIKSLSWPNSLSFTLFDNSTLQFSLLLW